MVIAFRLADWDTPFWANPNRRDSRFLAAGDRAVQYWALHPLTCWAEQLRGMDIRNAEAARELLLRPWAAQVQLPGDTLWLSFSNATENGIEPGALIDDEWTACQQWAQELRISALIVPSAALPGTENLVLFGPRVRIRWGMAPVDPTLEVPSDPVADQATVVSDLIPHVRYRGQSHPGYEAWRRGDPESHPPLVRPDRPS